MAERFEQLLSTLGQDLYSFAHALIPDHLQAYQIGLDSISAHLLSLHELGPLEELQQKEISEEEAKVHAIQLFSRAYTLGMRRHQQLGSLSTTPDAELDQYRGFYSLSLSEKAALYLRHQTAFSLEDIAVISGQSKLDVVNHLNLGRQKLALGLVPGPTANKGRTYEGPERTPER